MSNSSVTTKETAVSESNDDADRTIDELASNAFVDDMSGSGSLSSTEDWVRANHRPHNNDGRSPTRTYFDPRDVKGRYPGGQKHRDPSDRRSWQSLAGWQDGVQSDISRGGQNWWADKQRWVEIFTDKLHGSDYHETRCKQILEKIDMQPYQSAGINSEVVIVGIISLLIDAEIDDFENRALARDETKDLLSDLEATVGDYETVRKKLRKYDKGLLFPNSD